MSENVTARTSDEDAVLLRVRGLIKDFPGNRGLDEVSLDVRSGEVLAVVGHNGSGKSTLVKVLAGVYTADGGTVELTSSDGAVTEVHVIHQDLGLAAELTGIENLGITHYRGLGTIAPFRLARERAHARELIGKFGDPFDLDVPVGRLAPAQRAIIGIARALDGWTHSRNVLILDEPTEALHANEVRVLFRAVRTLAAQGAGIVFISHRLDEVLDLADRVVILRDGRKVADESRDMLDHDRLVSFVTGVPMGEAQTGEPFRGDRGDLALRVEGLRGHDVDSLDLHIHAGEVVGIAGVLGSGREALPGMLFGSLPAEAEVFEVHGRPYPVRTPRASIARGIAFVPGDRARYGSVRPMTARENITLPQLRSITNGAGALKASAERAEATRLIAEYDVRPPRSEQVFAQFSGGNQQKIVFAKWLRNDPAVLLLEEPTQGVDIGAKAAIYDAIDGAAAGGAGVLVCSSEAKELVRLCHRVLVLRNGAVTAELAGEQLTETALVKAGYGLEGKEPS